MDGVICDFHGPVIQYIKDRWDIDVSRKDILTDIRKYAQGKWDDEAEDFIQSDGFAQKLEPLPGAIDAIKSIMEKHEVIFVTAPYLGSKTWDHDRRSWLEEKFDINRDQLIFAHNKKLIQGMTIIDDKWDTVVDWSDMNKTTGIVFQQPWNVVRWENLKFESHHGLRWFRYKTLDKYSDFYVADGWSDALCALENFAAYQGRDILE